MNNLYFDSQMLYCLECHGGEPVPSVVGPRGGVGGHGLVGYHQRAAFPRQLALQPVAVFAGAAAIFQPFQPAGAVSVGHPGFGGGAVVILHVVFRVVGVGNGIHPVEAVVILYLFPRGYQVGGLPPREVAGRVVFEVGGSRGGMDHLRAPPAKVVPRTGNPALGIGNGCNPVDGIVGKAGGDGTVGPRVLLGFHREAAAVGKGGLPSAHARGGRIFLRHRPSPSVG